MIFQIEADFTYLYGEKNELLDGVENFSKLVIEKVFPKLVAKSCCSEDLELLKKVQQSHELSAGIL